MALFIKYTARVSNFTVNGTYLYDEDYLTANYNGFIQSDNIPNRKINNLSDYQKYVIIQNGPSDRLRSLYFSASLKNYIKIRNPFETFNSGLSFTFWFKAGSNPTWARLFDFGNGPKKDNIICFINSNKIGFSVYKGDNNSNSQFNVISNVLNNQWYHITWTLNINKTWNIYLNNQLYATYTNRNYPNSITRNLNYIAKSNWNDPYFTGNITDFRIYNNTIGKNTIEQIYYEGLGRNQFNVSNSKKQFKKNDLLYSYIFTDLNNNNQDSYKDCKNCSFEFIDNPSMINPSVNGPEGCKDTCSKNNKCTSYSYDNNNKQCFNYNNVFPDNIYTDVKGVQSGYKLNFPFDYTKLNDIQKNNVKKIIANEFLNYKFTPNKNINYKNCNSIRENANSTTFNNDPKCIFNLMRKNKISNNIDFQFDYRNNPKFVNSINDKNMINYYDKFKKNLFNVNERNILAPISNIGIHSPVDMENTNEPQITASDVSESIKSNIRPITDTFSNQYVKDYNNNKNYKILMIILLFIILGFFIYKLNK